MKRALIGAYLFVTMIFVPLAIAAEEQWKEYVYSSDGFAVSLPSEPHLKQMDKVHLYSPDESSSFRFRILVQVTGNEPAEQILKMYEPSILKAYGGAIASSEKKVTLLDRPGIRAEVEGKQGREIVDVYAVDGKIFVISGSASPEFERLVNSIRFMEPEFTEYSYPDEGFAISAPSEPVIEGNEKRIKSYTIDLPYHNGFRIEIAHYSHVLSKEEAESQLQIFEKDMEGSLKAKLITKAPVSLQSSPGLSASLDRNGIRIETRIYVRGSMLYALMTKASKGTVQSQKFLDSFRFLEAAE